MAEYGAGWPDGTFTQDTKPANILPCSEESRSHNPVPADIARLSLNQGGQDGPEPPPPAIQSAGVIPVDITHKFADAVKSMYPRSWSSFVSGTVCSLTHIALDPGELVKDGFFTLFESVAGLEVGCRHFYFLRRSYRDCAC